MTTSEPTTGELIEALRCDGVIKPCEGCFFAFQIENCAAMGCRTDDMFGLAADRLESQSEENEISRRLIEMQSNIITELIERAEQAERERDAFMKECDTGRTAGYKDGLEEGYKKGRDEGYDAAWKEARYEMNEE